MTAVVEWAPVRSEDWLTSSQVAELLELSVHTIGHLLADGKIKATRFGKGRGVYLVHRDDALAYQERVRTKVWESQARQRFPNGIDIAKPDYVTAENWEYLTRHVNQGQSYAEIAADLKVSRQVVEQAVRRVLRQLARGRSGR